MTLDLFFVMCVTTIVVVGTPLFLVWVCCAHAEER